jgi:putative ABC transport system substrate-binding protein
LNVAITSVEVRTPQDFASAYATIRQSKPDAIITVEDPLTNSHREQIAGFALELKLPSMHGFREFVEAGGLMSYGASLSDLYRRAAAYVDRILRGKPAIYRSSSPTNSSWSLI